MHSLSNPSCFICFLRERERERERERDALLVCSSYSSIYFIFLFLCSRRRGADESSNKFFIALVGRAGSLTLCVSRPRPPRLLFLLICASLRGVIFERVKRSRGIVRITFDASRFVDSPLGGRFSTCNWHLHRRERCAG